MSRTLRLASLVLVALGFMFLGCEEFNGNDPGGNGPVTVKLDPYGTDIIAGQSEDVGDIEVYFSDGNIYVEYTTTGDWYLYEAHVSIELDWEVIPQHNGNPVPGQFDYKDEFDNTQSYTFVIPWLEEWDDADYFYIAGHCALEKVVEGEVIEQQTGWGDGEDFPGSNWGMYFRIPVPKILVMPDGVRYKFTRTYGNIPYEFHVIPIDDDGEHDLPQGYYRSFCLQHGIYIYGQYYEGEAVSCYDLEDLPNWAKYVKGTTTPIPYDKIAYLINEYPPPQSTTLMVNLQNVFWYYSGWLAYGSLNAAQRELVSEADAFGEGYYPYNADGNCWMPILLLYSDAVQMIFIQVDP